MNKFLFILFISAFSFGNLFAQSKAELRYEIDSKRIGVYYNSENALVRSREFKRLDSSYYVGWMFEGTYRYERSADYKGFKLTARQLQKAFDLIYTDFKKEMTTRTGIPTLYYKHFQLRQDYDYIAYQLMNCYSNMERPDLVWKHLQRCKQINHQRELYCETYSYLAWTVHRNRFYTKSKYSFLKNSIKENEEYANALLDSAQLKLKSDAKFNDKFLSTDYYKSNISSVWHYRSILYSYQLNIVKAGETYKKLKATYSFPKNNFATFCSIQGKFREAAYYYNQAKRSNLGDKRLNESIYYSAILSVCRSLPKEAAGEIKDVLSANGTTPGFGWYNLSLARALLYDGQLAAAKKYTKTAEQFKEIHRGTTLGQSHYDFTTALLQLAIKEREIQQVKFMNKSWWYSFSNLGRVAKLQTEKYGLQFLIINQLAANPERELVIYKLFSTENTVSYDEIWHLISGFSTNYFIKKYKEYAANDERPLLVKYYEYYIAKLNMEKGDYRSASIGLNKIISDSLIDTEYEKLFLARVYIARARCLHQTDKTQAAKQFLHKAYKEYPQLLPFENLKLNFRLHASAKSTIEKNVLKELKKRNIAWLEENAKGDAIDVFVKFGKKENYPIISFETNYKGDVVVSKQEFTYKDAVEASKDLSLYLFNVGNEEKNFNMNDTKGNLYSLSGSQASNIDLRK